VAGSARRSASSKRLFDVAGDDDSTIARQLQPTRFALFGATPGLFIK
jgi:hypothetical protein